MRRIRTLYLILQKLYKEMIVCARLFLLLQDTSDCKRIAYSEYNYADYNKTFFRHANILSCSLLIMSWEGYPITYIHPIFFDFAFQCTDMIARGGGSVEIDDMNNKITPKKRKITPDQLFEEHYYLGKMHDMVIPTDGLSQAKNVLNLIGYRSPQNPVEDLVQKLPDEDRYMLLKYPMHGAIATGLFAGAPIALAASAVSNRAYKPYSALIGGAIGGLAGMIFSRIQYNRQLKQLKEYSMNQRLNTFLETGRPTPRSLKRQIDAVVAEQEGY